MKNVYLKFAAVLALNLTSVGALAQNAPAPNTQAVRLSAFTHPQQVPADLARISTALNSTASFAGRFSQYASDGSFSQGRIYLKRPGKIRFEYDAPESLLLVSDGVTLTQVDKALDTKDRVPLKSTPLAFFLAENVDLENDVEVIALQKTSTSISVTAKDGTGEMDGTITMVFNPQTLALREWNVHDGFGQQTRVILSNLKYNERLNPRLFIMRDNKRGQNK
ncbi:MAG: outer membrane lipoprotein carrier protein LolA [Robiginitomaculum sp.]